MKNFVVFESLRTNRKYSRPRGDVPIQVSYIGMWRREGYGFQTGKEIRQL